MWFSLLFVGYFLFPNYVLSGANTLVGGWSKISEADFMEYEQQYSVMNEIGTNLLASPLVNGVRTSGLRPDVPFCFASQVVQGIKLKVFFQAHTDSQPDNKITCASVVWIVSWYKPPVQSIHTTCGNAQSLEAEHLCPKSRPKRDLLNEFDKHTTNMVRPTTDADVKILFDMFLEKYPRQYSSSSDEYNERFEIFKTNYQVIQHLNEIERGTAVYGITKFMDMSEEEYHRTLAPGFTRPLVPIQTLNSAELDTTNIPDSMDWRKHGAVTEVKNQGSCGSCWAFSTTGNVEGQWFLKHKKLISLSEQELVDCDTLDSGCGGGLPSNAYKSIEKLGGLEPEKDYPYVGEGEKCAIKRSDFKVFVNNSVALPKDEVKLAAWLAQNGPISIGINANLMQFYWGGISHPWKIFCNPKSLDHGVLIVGYGTENGTPFWIIKNSWGPDWGEEGYYRIYRGDGSCGLNNMATSSIVD
ncbi:cathepsin L-like [Ciona intestinalis]